MIHVDVAPLPHPFYVDADGVNRTPGPDKHPYYTEFAASGSGVVPVVRQVSGEWLPALLICRYDDVREVLRRQDVFSRSAAAHADQVDVSGTMLGVDGAEHAAIRGTVKGAFTRSAVSDLRDMVRAAAEAQLAVLVAKGGRADLAGDFAIPFALNVISDLLGVPEPDRAQFRRWGDMFMGSGDVGRPEAARSAEEMGGYLWQQLDGRRRCPADDLMTQIATAGATHSVDVQVKLPLSLIVGGWETTASSIATFVYLLTTRPYGRHDHAWDHLVAHPEQVDGAVAELERLHSTTNGDEMPRRVMAEVTLPSGARLAEGDIVIPSHDAANRDPRIFPDPTRMDFGREKNPHLSFGYGPHYCVGAHLGAMEVRIALALLLREMPGLRLAVAPDEVRWKQAHAILGPGELPVRW
jgi:cytochrome P450